MIHGMYCRKMTLVASLSVLFSLALNASAKGHPRLGFQSTPTLEVFVYGFPGLSTSLLQEAEAETDRILTPVSIRLDWINCISRTATPQCFLPQLATDITVRFLPKALPQAAATALGFANSSADSAAAFLFYDRIAALRTERRLLFPMFGRVLAHEITHLLLPNEAHSDSGLMRGLWSTSDLTVTSTACLFLSARSVQLMYGEALRRVRIKDRARGR